MLHRLVVELGIRSPGGAAAKHSGPSPSASGTSPTMKVVSGEQLIKNAQKRARSMSASESASVPSADLASVKMKLEPLTPSRQSLPTPHSIAMETVAAPMETDVISRSKPAKLEQQVKQEPPTSEQLSAVVEFCSEALGRGVLSLHDLRNRLLLKQTSLAGESPLHVLSQQGVSDKLLEEGLRLCGALEVGQPCDRRLFALAHGCLLYTSPSPRDATLSRMPSSA